MVNEMATGGAKRHLIKLFILGYEIIIKNPATVRIVG